MYYNVYYIYRYITNIYIFIYILYIYAQTPRFAHTLLVLGRSTKVLGNIKVPPPLNFTVILLYNH